MKIEYKTKQLTTCTQWKREFDRTLEFYVTNLVDQIKKLRIEQQQMLTNHATMIAMLKKSRYNEFLNTILTELIVSGNRKCLEHVIKKYYITHFTPAYDNFMNLQLSGGTDKQVISYISLEIMSRLIKDRIFGEFSFGTPRVYQVPNLPVGNRPRRKDYKPRRKSRNPCGICREEIYEFEIRNGTSLITPCGHLFHKECVCQWLRPNGSIRHQPSCPMCRQSFTRLQIDQMCPPLPRTSPERIQDFVNGGYTSRSPRQTGRPPRQTGRPVARRLIFDDGDW